MSEWSQEDVQKAVKKICEKAIADASFYAKAISDPNGAIKDVTGKEVPGTTKIRFVPLEGADLAFVLPTPESCGGELSESDLESVAGGRGAGGSIGIGLPGVSIGVGGSVNI
jgi:hypothetical protein